jgi:GNAT superfamily N-acetyltransferase
MKLTLERATSSDAGAIAELRNAVADDLERRHGPGPGMGHCTDKGVLYDFRNAQLYAARDRGRIIASLVLATRKPWSIDRSLFTPCPRPLYLIAMVVAPDRQRQGVGRRCLDEAARIARAFPSQAIWLDAYDAPSGAGGFYAKCGYREVGRATYRKAPLIYFERTL